MEENKRVYNFSAGPSMLPLPVLEKAASELVNYRNTGMSVMEMSHRSSAYSAIIQQTEASLRQLMGIPDDYAVLFLQGGASTQFAAVPLNLINLSPARKALYAVTGQFSGKAYKEALKLGYEAVCVADGKGENFSKIPAIPADKLDQDASYLHICYNNTIYGTRYPAAPETGKLPLVADVSSCILSEPIDVSKFGVLYAGAQKNMGPAGVTVVIVRKDLLGHAEEKMPTMLDWTVMAEHQSMYNPPPCYSIYILGLVCEHVLETGGLDAMKIRNERKAALLYDYLDSQSYYTAPVHPSSRSIMNVTFVTGDPDLDSQFAAEAAKAGLQNLKGHRSVGGMRASIDNAMPDEGVRARIEFMERFAAGHPKA
ncbi:MAG: 3-phosphoserine/phosphohydroxythreonine transaminase [Clostridia bacterium]|nr:3-phosphoserine/phosphohydroxythreonine transaminase [Clostridia bacterium]